MQVNCMDWNIKEGGPISWRSLHYEQVSIGQFSFLSDDTIIKMSSFPDILNPGDNLIPDQFNLAVF